ncbi:hypothetical protein NRB_13860 [Novosphingobium sp. 11B]
MAFRIIGIILVIALIAWVVAAFVFSFGAHPAPNMLGIGSAFEGNLQLPAEKIAKAFADARAKMLEVNATGSHLKTASAIGAWLSFAATAGITLIIGFLGRPLPALAGQPDTSGLSIPLTRTIGLLAAAAAVLTAFGSLAATKAEEHFKHADELRTTIVQSRKAVLDAKTADEAQAVLDDLALKMGR